MATVYRETYTKPLPAAAEVFTREGQRFARWTDRRGRKRIAKVTTPAKGRHAGEDRVVLACNTHTAKYRDGSGVVRKVGTGCPMRDAAETVLSDLRGRAELVKANVLTAAQDAAADHAATPIDRHTAGYVTHLGLVASPEHVANVRRQLDRLIGECGFRRLGDLRGEALERWLSARRAEGMSARTANTYVAAATAFAGWCMETDRLIVNPFANVARADEKADRRRMRRALTEDELRRLLTVARLRPLAEYGREAVKLQREPDKRRRSNWMRAPLTFANITEAAKRGRAAVAKRAEFIAELEYRGREHALIYKALVLTGLRKGELASLTVGQLDLESAQPYAVLEAADEKNRQGSEIPLWADLAADLRVWIGSKLKAVQAAARRRIGEPVPMRLPADTPVFNVPEGLIRILDRDLAAAGIPKRDERGRVVDVHAFRTTFGTHLSKGGVPLRTAQAAMRHSRPDLTANVYTDPKLLDVAGALDALPLLPLDAEVVTQTAKATGTTGDVTIMAGVALQETARTLVPTLVPNPGKPCILGATADHLTRATMSGGGADAVSVSACNVNDKAPADTRCQSGASRAGDGTRTRNSQLGRLALYH